MAAVSMKTELESFVLSTIPLSAAMQLQVTRADVDEHGVHVEFFAPLAPNINDKGCAFGGSEASLLTLACWSLLWLLCKHQAIKANIFVHTSRMIYQAPLWGDMRVRANLSHQAAQEFIARLQEKGKSAEVLHAVVLSPAVAEQSANEEGLIQGASLEARFVAMLTE
jgi:thioesterase domain-containing protein